MIDVDDAWGLEEKGLKFTDEDGNVEGYLAISDGDPTGTPAPINTWAFDKTNLVIYYKFGSSDNEWRALEDQHSGVDSVNDTTEVLVREGKQMINFTCLTIDGDLCLEGDLWLA